MGKLLGWFKERLIDLVLTVVSATSNEQRGRRRRRSKEGRATLVLLEIAATALFFVAMYFMIPTLITSMIPTNLPGTGR